MHSDIGGLGHIQTCRHAATTALSALPRLAKLQLTGIMWLDAAFQRSSLLHWPLVSEVREIPLPIDGLNAVFEPITAI